MSQYINKIDVIAEIEKRIQELHPTNTHKIQVGEKMDRDVLMWLNALTWVKKILNTIEVKEVNLDKEIDKWIEDWTCNGYCSASIAETAEYFFELGLKSQKGE